MHKITLVCSAHRESGLCNSEELLKVLQAIGPEVVFEEIRPSEFDLYYKHGSRRSLESQAITKYAKFKSFKQVPIDGYEMPQNFRAETDSVFDFVELTSHEYEDLNEENANKVYHYGYDYLNSVEFATLMARLTDIEDATISRTRDQGLISGLKRWRYINQKRDFEMVNNIYKYARENAFGTGVFLVGAAHKAGIVKEITEYANAGEFQIDWNRAFGGRIP